MSSFKGHENHKTELSGGDYSCDACDDRSIPNSYYIYCYDCNFVVHTKCTFVFCIPETYEHLSHVGHCLKLLTTGAPAHTDPKCHLCCKKTKLLLYHCSICNVNLDISCMVNDMSARAVINMPWHRHPLVKLDSGHQMRCEVCGRLDGNGYFCPTCKFMVHEKCVAVFNMPPITHPLHVRHSLKLLTEGAPGYTDSKCHVCGKLIENLLYHCVICKFNLDMACAIENHQQHTLTPVVLSNKKFYQFLTKKKKKVYEHTLTLIPRLILFICDACGTKGDRSPYVSLQGGDNMFFHQNCVHLPHVIHVNRHDHRVSYTYPLGLGEWKCEICSEDIDWSCGAYSCSLCPNYALHSICATNVWDGKELDGEPEEVEDSEPFKLNDDNTITHFAHEQHKMSLNKEGIALEESILCEGCGRPIASDTFYKCSACNFIMHKTCANLPKIKRHFLSPRPLNLRLMSSTGDIINVCAACGQYFTKGFVYTNGDESFDLVCCSITVPFIHQSHEHPLLYLGDHNQINSCQNCGKSKSRVKLGCIQCNYYLDFLCATLPLTVSLHNYDAHPLNLCCAEKASGKHCCDICEREINSKKWFYTCNDCWVTVHTFCVLGVLIRYARPGKFGESAKLMFNNTSWRPVCYTCHCRCMGPYFFMYEMISFCSYYCILHVSLGKSSLVENYPCPPWIEELNA